MRILFCKISSMKHYKGVTENDKPTNGGSFVKDNGFGFEEYNFMPRETENGEYCFGYVEAKGTIKGKSNQLRIEKINGCENYKNLDSVDNVLVVWCATTYRNETSVVGWYKNATVYRNYQPLSIENKDALEDRNFNVKAKAEDCVLIPESHRIEFKWSAPVAKKKKYGFGQAMTWYASEGKAQDFINDLIGNIDKYNEENWV